MGDSNNNTQDFVRLPYFDWDKAKDFYYVAKLGSFSEAGKFLNISQSSLSRKIKILEDHLNFRVFTRLPHGLELTRKGQELFTIIERTFLDLKGLAYNPAVVASNGQKRKIRIATTHAMAAYIFNDIFIEYNNINPYICFELIGQDRLLDVFLNDVDIAIRPIDQAIKDLPYEQNIVHEYLFSLEKRLYASEEYLKKHGNPLSVNDLANHHLIAFGHPEKHPYSDINWILGLGMPVGKYQTPIFTSNSVECMIDAAKSGLGIVGSYPEMKIIKNSGLINILPHIKGKKLDEYLIFPNHLEKDKDVIELRSFMHEKLSNYKS